MAAKSLRAPTTILGIDFSGAKDAHRKIWIATGVIERGVLHIEDCQSAQELLGVTDRDQCLSALRDFISLQSPCAVGLDFPFGLPKNAVTSSTWEEFAVSFGQLYPTVGKFDEAFRAPSGHREERRDTDSECKTPFSPFNLRLYRQTYYGIRDVLAPLVRDRLACILPMQVASPQLPWLLEICPASTLARLGLRRPYKGPGAEKRAARTLILEAIEKKGMVTISSSMLRAAVIGNPGGDALDSVTAALATCQAIHHPVHPSSLGPDPSNVEGHVYI